MAASSVQRISQCTINPEISPESKKIYYLAPWDIAMLSVDYIQKGLLYNKPSTSITTILDQLKNSLSQTLIHFPVLLGRLATIKESISPSYSVVLDCTNPQGAAFIHAKAVGLTISDILFSNDDIPVETVNSFFAFNHGINHDGHNKPLLAVQVTELVDGIFIGCSLNHCLVDGTSYWHFFNTWSEVSRGNIESISRPPVIERLFFKGHNHLINFPFTHHDEFLEPYKEPPLRQIMFHFSAKSIAELKARANREANTNKISSFQALSALVWRCMTRARNFPVDQKTSCRMAINSRSRLKPAFSSDYFGNCIKTVSGTTTAGELGDNNLGWAAWMLHEAIAGHTDEKIRSWIHDWLKNPMIYNLRLHFDVHSMMMGSSPRFDMYGNDFGWGRPIGARSGKGNKFDGKVSSYPGREGGGSVDLEVCLPTKSMTALLLDDEFMDAVSSS